MIAWNEVAGLCYEDHGKIVVHGGPQAADLANLPPLVWPAETLGRHGHHHHRFDAAPSGAAREIEASRGCPYHCTFCAKENFRDRYRRRPLATILAELDGLIAAGVTYVYFIDEIFLPWRQLLEAVAARPVRFGVQTRIDLWSREMLDLLGAAGCVSIEAGVESLTHEGRDWLEKHCKLSTQALTELLIYAKRSVPFVQANLIASGDDTEMVQRWRDELRKCRRVGERSSAVVPVSRLAGLPSALGSTRRQCVGTCGRLLPRPVRHIQRDPGRAPAPACRSRGAFRIMIRRPRVIDRPPTVLMTADAVGGVWSYAVGLCRSLPETRFVLATMGPRPRQAQREAIHELENVTLVESDYRLEWMADGVVDFTESCDWLIDLTQRYEVDVIHVNGYAHARLDVDCPVVVVAHSDVLSWWEAVHKSAAPPEMGRISQTSNGRACRGRPRRRADRRGSGRSRTPLWGAGEQRRGDLQRGRPGSLSRAR